MDQSEIIRACLERGILVSEDDIRRMEAGLSVYDFIASKAQRDNPQQQDGKTGRIVCRVRKPKAASEITPADIVESRRKKYDAIKSMLLPKASAISISNAGDSRVQLSVIGVVKRLSPDGFVLEDPTGEMEMRSDAKGVAEGDVIGCRGPVSGSRMICKDIILPDVPLIRPIGRAAASLLVGAKPSGQADVVASLEPVQTDAKNILLDGSPSVLSVHKDGAKVVVLFFRPESPVGPQDAVGMLKKRCLKVPATSDAESCVIDPVPDVFWIHGKSGDWTEIYKGVLVVHTSERSCLINLETKEAKPA
jgi:hypothetical protein